MKHTLLAVSCLSLGLGAAGCGGASRPPAGARADAGGGGCVSEFARDDAPRSAQPRLSGAAVGTYNKGYVDGVNASAFFNKGQPLTDDQVDRLVEIGRRQGDPTGLLALPGYSDGYRTGARHAHNPYEQQMTTEQVAQVRKAQGLPPAPSRLNEPAQRHEDAQASARASEKKQAREQRKEDRKSKRVHKESAEASAR